MILPAAGTVHAGECWNTGAGGAANDHDDPTSTACGDDAEVVEIRSTAFGSRSRAWGVYSTAVGYSADAAAYGVAIGANALTLNPYGVAIGRNSNTNTHGTAIGYSSHASTRGVAVGSAASASDTATAALGYLARATEYNSTAIGAYTIASAAYGTAQGYGAVANDLGNTATGALSEADGVYSTALGYQSNASVHYATAVGGYTDATSTGATAVGYGAQATAYSSVALGRNSVAARSNSVSVGGGGITRQITNVAAGNQATDAVNLAQLNAATAAFGNQVTQLQAAFAASPAMRAMAFGAPLPAGAGLQIDAEANTVSMGSAGNERRVVNVAAGVRATDAVNVEQLQASRTQAVRAANSYTDAHFQQMAMTIDELEAWADDRFRTQDGRIDQIGAMGTAMSSMAMNTAGLTGRNRMGVGVGSHGGEQAVSIGYQRALGDSGRASVSIGAVFSGDESSIGAGAGFSW